MIPIFVLGVISVFSIFSESKGKSLNFPFLEQRFDFQISPADSSLLRSDTSFTQVSQNLNPDSNIVENISDSLNLSVPQQISDTLNLADTLNLSPSDSTALLDTVKLDSLSMDSSARLRHFNYTLQPKYTYSVTQPRKSNFFAYPATTFMERTVELDSTGQFVLIKERTPTGQQKLFMKMPISEYIALRISALENESWAKLGYAYEFDDGKRGLSDLFADITNIEIPLPSTSFLSIFGPPKISLRISGAVDIKGAWRSETTEGVTASALGNTRNEPDFKQQVQINVAGTIGDKLTISADWNTERTFEYENQLKIKYTGYEDEIVQSIEAGNVSLQTAPLVGGSEALFGVKALFKFGPFSLTALASQKKGEVQEVSISGGSEKQEFEKRLYEYSTNHYFLDEVYADTDPALDIFNKYYGESTPIVLNEYEVKDIEVWKTTNAIVDKSKERRANAFINLPAINAGESYGDEFRGNEDSQPGLTVIGGRFVKLEPDIDYILHPKTGYISFRSQVQKEDAIAVAYRREGQPGPDNDLYFGEFLNNSNLQDTSVTMVLKLVKPANLKPDGDYATAWKLMLKNIYPIGGRDVKQEGFEFQIKYQEPTGDPKSDYQGLPYIQAFGLDKTNADGTSDQPDGAFDFKSGLTINAQTGEIIFPVLQPFGEQYPPELPEERKFQEVYDLSTTFAQQEKSKDKFLLTGVYSAASSSTFNIGFNVVENSVEVYLGGRKLNRGTDYTVDYNIGQVTILNNDALNPGADLRITFEQNDLFQLASKTLLGLRGIYQFDKDSHIGFSFLNLNQQTLSDKVRIGEEPLNNTIYGVDMKTKLDLPFVTDLLDNVISTSEMSSITLSGEYAYMSPDPNTKKSTIASDQDKSIAYIDDFEGSKRIIPIGNTYGQWRDLSVPNRVPLHSPESSPIELMDYKAFSYWFNLIPAIDNVNDIWPERQAARDNQTITVLDFVYDPFERGRYNSLNPTIDNPFLNWGGMMKPLSSTASNLVEENIEFIEFWMQLRSAPEDAMLNIDLGQISEDVIPNGELDTEDKNQNDLVDEGEDTGIDGLFDSEEPGYDPVTNPDPNRDNFAYSQGSGDYRFINGTEGNAALTDVGRLPDTEDLNRNLTLDRINSYFRYTIPLDTLRENNQFIQGGGDNKGWYLFRIPLKDFTDAIGNPSLTLVETIRLWISNVDEPIHLRFAEMNLVGNQWRKVLNPPKVTEDDEVLKVTTINIEDNPEYNSPPGVQRERDRSKPDEEVFKNEQSLNLILTNLEDGDRREIVKYLYKPLDLFNYRELKMFLHGDMYTGRGSVSYYEDERTYGAEIYFRFGSDTSNYYEYRQPVRKGWNEVSMIFSELTAIKEQREVINEVYRVFLADGTGASYAVKGEPTLTRVSYFIIGIQNPKLAPDSTRPNNFGEPVSGSVWVNELRVLDAEDTPGWAYTASASVKFADLLNVDVNTSQTDPYFHRLSERFGKRIDERSWGININFDLLKLIPVNLQGSNLRLNYSRRESISKPLYLPGTDVNVDQAAEKLRIRMIENGLSDKDAQVEADRLKFETQTLSTTDTWSLNGVKIVLPTDAWYIKETINNITLGFNYNITQSRNPTTERNEKWVWNANMNYNLNFSKENYFKPVDIPIIGDFIGLFDDYKDVKVFFSPTKFDAAFTASRNYSFNLTRTDSARPNIQRDFTTTRKFGFGWQFTEGGLLNLGLNYSADFQSSLTNLLTKEIGVDSRNQPIIIERSESEIWSDIFGGAFFGDDFNFKQSFDLRAQPKLPTLWGIDKAFSLTLNYSVSYNWRNNFTQAEIGRSASWSNRYGASLNIRWKSLWEPLFGEESKSTTATRPGATQQQGRGGRTTRGQGRETERDVDKEIEGANEETVQSDSTEIDDGPSTISKGFSYIKAAIKYILVDYDQIRFNFTQTTSLANTGLAGAGTGFNNFWGFSEHYSKGPSRAYMLGFSFNAGPRAPNGNLSDNFSQKNNFDFSTSRPLWEGATLDVKWNVGWGIQKNTSLETNEDGTVTITNLNSSGTLDRSFLSIPNFLFFNFFDNNIAKVASLYNPNAERRSENLSNAFIEGFESFPWLSKIPLLGDFIRYIPRPNWSITWSGLEKFSFLKDIAQRVQLKHAYTSKYTEGWKIDPDGNKQIQTQKITYGFAPLVGVSLTFTEIFDGNVTGSVQYNTTSNYDLGTTTRNITEGFSKDISFTASYSKSGFEIPLFGLSLQNDIEISLSYTTSENSTVIYEMDNFNEEGTPQDGTTRTSIEPRIKYVMSSRVTLSLFYKRTSVEPKGAARIPPTTTNEAGLEVHISIQ